MLLTIIPGYTDLFGPSPKTYEQYLQEIPTSLVLPILIGINAEMYASLPDADNQRRMRNIFSDNFTPAQADKMNRGYLRYKKLINPSYEGEIFGNRYLVYMCIRELNRNDKTQKIEISQEDEFNIIQAYLMVVQELNDEDEGRYKLFRQSPIDDNYNYRLLWAGFINQFEFTDVPHATYNVYRHSVIAIDAKQDDLVG